jgi:hypothetical protein
MQLRPETFQLAVLLFQGLAAILGGLLVYAWNRSTKQSDRTAEKVVGLEREFLEFARQVERDRATLVSRTELDAMQERLQAAMHQAIAPVAADVALIKNAFMEIRRG